MQRQRKNVHITLSIPQDLKDWLYANVARGEISHFVSEMLNKARKASQEELALAFKEAAKDAGQLEAMNDWKGLENEDFYGVEWDEG
jgi:hypothetical protein